LFRFEKQLRTRLSLKTGANTSEEATLTKTFRYFDIYNRGEVTSDQFYKTMDKLGLSLSFQRPQVDEVFQVYDRDDSGVIDYKQWAAFLCRATSSQYS
jgi:Ca2+-binding EF-hand superfamily protein